MIAQLLALIMSIASTTSETATIARVIEALMNWIPVVIQEARDLYPMIKNIIAALSQNPATTAEQLATLKALDVQSDAKFEAAAAGADAEDAAAGDPVD